MLLTGAASALLAFAAFGATALSMDRHHRQVFERACSPAARRRLRIAAWIGFLLAVLVAVSGGPIALVNDVLAAGLAAAAVMGLLTVGGARWLPFAARTAGLAGVGMLIAAALAP